MTDNKQNFVCLGCGEQRDGVGWWCRKCREKKKPPLAIYYVINLMADVNPMLDVNKVSTAMFSEFGRHGLCFSCFSELEWTMEMDGAGNTDWDFGSCAFCKGDGMHARRPQSN